MKDFYSSNPVNQYRVDTDIHFADYDNKYAYRGFLDNSIRYITDFQLNSAEHWARFVDQFRLRTDNVIGNRKGDYYESHNAGWRGEYWGKMMRGACFVYSYLRDEELYALLTETVEEILTTADKYGRISTYEVEGEFNGWDLWSRKYVLLGLQYFLEICRDEALKARIIESMCGQVDYLIGLIGKSKDGKKPITSATRNWLGLNSCSLLEPVVRLYMLTKEERFFDFATYIVGTGFTSASSLVELAYNDEIAPYQYPITKAYEMISCFEGLLEYYRVTKNEYYLTAVKNFANRILENDFTIIGSAGCTHELFDHSTVRQANTNNGLIQQETCVTVTIMKFLYQVHLVTGDPKYVDAFEVSLYNAYLGAVNTEKVVEPTTVEKHPDWCIEPLPFDSYSPLVAGTRGNGIGGLQLMEDMHYYGCCACIGAAGIGLVPKVQLLTAKDGFIMNLYINGTAETVTESGNALKFTTDTEYPRLGDIKITLTLDTPEAFTLRLRKPSWSTKNSVSVSGSAEIAFDDDGYIAITKEWRSGDTVTLKLDMRTKAVYPIAYEPHLITMKGGNNMWQVFDHQDPLAMKHISLRRGPITLAQENRLGYSVDTPVDIAVGADGYVDVTLPETDKAPYVHIVEVEVPLTDGTKMTVTDYSSAGKLWTEESKMAAWFLTE